MLTYRPFIKPLAVKEDYQVDVLRLDQLHPEVGGNKWFKLKYNLECAKSQGHTTILTFGGAFSNHIAATAAACQLAVMSCVGIIRGEETNRTNPTLLKAEAAGMRLHFVSRTQYNQKETPEFKQYLLQQFGPHYLIPEGGNNGEGLKGCMEIVPPNSDYDYILCACGTATTFAGILASAKSNQKVIGISVLKGENTLPAKAQKLVRAAFPSKLVKIDGNEELEKEKILQSCITNAYCFNGYARFHQDLLCFKTAFEEKSSIPLDHVYTAKLFYAAMDLIAKRKFKIGSKMLIIHSGGLQGNRGFEEAHPGSQIRN